jgi:putative PIN family toxin of toxin-antitoxin system
MSERLVIDTSVLVAAIKSSDGGSRAVLRLCLKRRCQPIVGQNLLTEYEDVMGRTGLFRRSPLSATERDELLSAFLSVCVWIPVFFLWRPNLPDEGDNHLIELAVAGAATKLITHNVRDIRAGELRFPQFEVQTPATFLKQWRETHGDDDDSDS